MPRPRARVEQVLAGAEAHATISHPVGGFGGRRLENLKPSPGVASRRWPGISTWPYVAQLWRSARPVLPRSQRARVFRRKGVHPVRDAVGS